MCFSAGRALFYPRIVREPYFLDTAVPDTCSTFWVIHKASLSAHLDTARSQRVTMFYHHNFTSLLFTTSGSAVDNSEVQVETFAQNKLFAQLKWMFTFARSYPQGCAPVVDRTQPRIYPQVWINLWKMR